MSIKTTEMDAYSYKGRDKHYEEITEEEAWKMQGCTPEEFKAECEAKAKLSAMHKRVIAGIEMGRGDGFYLDDIGRICTDVKSTTNPNEDWIPDSRI